MDPRQVVLPANLAHGRGWTRPAGAVLHPLKAFAELEVAAIFAKLRGLPYWTPRQGA